MGISTKEISEVIKARLKDFDASLVATDVGRIVATGDGIAQIYGLQNAMAGELLEFPKETYGLALNLEEDQVRAVILGSWASSGTCTRETRCAPPGGCSRFRSARSS